MYTMSEISANPSNLNLEIYATSQKHKMCHSNTAHHPLHPLLIHAQHSLTLKGYIGLQQNVHFCGWLFDAFLNGDRDSLKKLLHLLLLFLSDGNELKLGGEGEKSEDFDINTESKKVYERNKLGCGCCGEKLTLYGPTVVLIVQY
jgi:hypothetical protein